jgi:hypothetical protein
VAPRAPRQHAARRSCPRAGAGSSPAATARGSSRWPGPHPPPDRRSSSRVCPNATAFDKKYGSGENDPDTCLTVWSRFGRDIEYLQLSLDRACLDLESTPACQHSSMGSDVASIALSLVALIAAAASLALQARDLFASRHQEIRNTQLELVRMAIEDPILYLGYEPTEDQRIRFRHQGYVNIFLKYFELGFLTGTLGETEVRHQMGELFANDGPREVWPRIRKAWRVEATSSLKRRFVEIVDREFQLASPSTPSTPKSEGDRPAAE